MVLLLGAGLLLGMWLLARVKQDCLWCGKKERLYGNLLCSLCTTLARTARR